MIFKDYKLKLRHIVLTFIKVNICTALFYLIFYLLFVIKLEISVIASFTDYFLPLGLSALTTLIWLRPKLKLLIFRSNKDVPVIYYIVCLGFMTWLMVVLANWLVLMTNPLIEISNVEDMQNKEKSRFYDINKYSILTENTIFAYKTGRNRKHHYYYMNLYIAAPFNTKQKNISTQNYRYWILKSYYHEENTSTAEATRDYNFDQFKTTSLQNFKSGEYTYFTNHFERIPYSEERKYALMAIRKIVPGTRDKDVIILSPSVEYLPDEEKNALKYSFISFFAGIAALMLMLIFPKFNHRKKEKENILRKYGRMLIASFSHNK